MVTVVPVEHQAERGKSVEGVLSAHCVGAEYDAHKGLTEPMFQAPGKTTKYVAPQEPIDIDQRYIFKLVNLEDQGVSKFADEAKGETYHNIQWTFYVAHQETRKAVMNVDGEPWEHIEYTTSKTGKNPKNGLVAKARLFIEALLGHSVEDDEITADLPQTLIGKYGSGFFEEKEMESQTGETYTKLKILKLGPYRAGKTEEPKPAPKPF